MGNAQLSVIVERCTILGGSFRDADGSVKIADHSFADNSESSPYVDAGITYPATDGYIKAFGYNEEFDWLLITSEVGGDSSLPVGDYFYQNRAGNTGVLLFWAVIGMTVLALAVSVGVWLVTMLLPF